MIDRARPTCVKFSAHLLGLWIQLRRDVFRKGDFMKRIDAIVRPEKLQAVIKALHLAGVNGFTAIPAQGRGQEKNTRGVYRGHTYDINLHQKVKLEIVVSDDYLERTIQAVMDAAQTGEMGDGKIFVYSVLQAYNIRTGAVDETIDELNQESK